MKKEELQEKSKKDLVDIAKELGISKLSKLTKEELIDEITSLNQYTNSVKETNTRVKQEVSKSKVVTTVATTITPSTMTKKVNEPIFLEKSPAPQERYFPQSDTLRSSTVEPRYQQQHSHSPSYGDKYSHINEKELPYEYGDTKIVFIPRDPFWGFVYWEIDYNYRKEHGIERYNHNKKLILRVWEINNDNAENHYDISINDYTNSWYLKLPKSNQAYRIDLGFIDEHNNYIELVRSNVAYVPRENVSDDLTLEWMTVDGDFNCYPDDNYQHFTDLERKRRLEELYKLSGGYIIEERSGSASFMRIQSKNLLEQLSSGALSSFNIQQQVSMKPKKDFWLVVDAELIVYGATEPGSKVYIQNKEVAVNDDGTFSTRFYLPDGEQVIPVRAVNSDGDMERIITPIVNRITR